MGNARSKNGWDVIDLRIRTQSNQLDGDPAVLVKKRMLFLLDLDKAIGEQQVNFILHRPSISPHSTIAEVAKKTGVRLV